ncbi:MAG: NUDIX hydrolase [Candidatus Accumulibacter sp.]|nr:NUDIX hydrolase [Accumulibacter sp.]
MVWMPHVTVAAVAEREGRFLLVEEETDEGLRFNQPAGHLERGETLVEAVVRETLEETGHTFSPGCLVGVYQWNNPRLGIDYLRFVFGGEITGHDARRKLDDGIVAARWLSLEEIRASAGRLRSPMVLRAIDDWLAGRRWPLDFAVWLA